MKKLISGLIIGGILATSVCTYAEEATSWRADLATFKVMVRGEEFISENPPIVVEGRTYLPLRAMGNALGVPVEWNAELKQAEVAMSDNEPDSGEVKAPVQPVVSDITSWTAYKATFKVMVRGEEFISENPPIVVEGRTYLPLRAMGEALGVPVEWNAELRQAEVDMKSTPAPSPTPTAQPTAKPTSTTETKITTIEAKEAKTIELPIKISFDESKAINTFNFTLSYDDEKLEFKEAKPGDIITDPDTNFEYNLVKDTNLIKFLFLNYTLQEDGAIKDNGVCATLVFEVKGDASEIQSELSLVGKPTFGDFALSPLNVEISAGEVKVVK